MTASHETLLKIGQSYGNVLIKLLDGVTTLYSETLISSASRLAGTSMFRSASLDTGNAPPGQPVVFAGADAKVAQLTKLITVTVQQLGHAIDINRAKASLDPASISSISVLETQSRFEPLFRSIAKTAGLTLTESAAAAAIASALLICQRPRGIDINRAYITAVFGVHEGLKQVPAALVVDSK